MDRGLPTPPRRIRPACEAAGFTPHNAYTSDDSILPPPGLGVTTMRGLALRSYRAEGRKPAS